MDPNKAESAREEVEEKIRGKRKPAWGRLEEGGRVVNTRAGKAAREKVQNRCHLMESWTAASGCAMGWRGNFSQSKGERNRGMSPLAP